MRVIKYSVQDNNTYLIEGNSYAIYLIAILHFTPRSKDRFPSHTLFFEVALYYSRINVGHL